VTPAGRDLDLRLGFLDGKPGFIYCVLKGIQRFHAKAKWYELEQTASEGA